MSGQIGCKNYCLSIWAPRGSLYLSNSRGLHIPLVAYTFLKGEFFKKKVKLNVGSKWDVHINICHFITVIYLLWK